MRSNFGLRAAGAAILAVASPILVDGALAGGHGGGHGGGYAGGGAFNTGGHWAGGGAFGPGLGQHWVPAPSQGGGYGGAFGGGASSVGGHWVGGSGFGPGLGQHWAPAPGGHGGGYPGFAAPRRAYGGGFSGHGVWYRPHAYYGGYTFHRHGLPLGFGGFGGGYWGGGGVYYPDPGFDYGYGFDYAEGRPAAYNGLTGYPPAFYPAPTYERPPLPLHEAPTVAYGPTIVNVAAPPGADPHVIYLQRAAYHPRHKRCDCARDK